MHRVSMPPQWRTDRSDAGAPRAFLLPELFTGAGNFPAALGFVRSGALPGAVVLHRFPEQILVDRAKNLVGQVECAHLRAAQIVYVDSCHIAFVFVLGWPTITDQQPTTAPTLSSPLASLPSTDRPSPSPRIHGAHVAPSLPWGSLHTRHSPRA